MYDSTDFTYLPIDGLDPMIAYEKPLVKKVTNNSSNCEEELPKKPVGRLLVNGRSTVGRQVFWGALLHNYRCYWSIESSDFLNLTPVRQYTQNITLNLLERS